MHNAIFQDWEAAFGDEDDEDEQECNTHPEKTSQPEATVKRMIRRLCRLLSMMYMCYYF